MWKLDESCVPYTCLNFSIRFHSKDFNANFISLKGHNTSFSCIIGQEDKSYPSCRAQCQRQPRRGRRPWRCNTFKVVYEQLFPHRLGKQSSVEYSSVWSIITYPIACCGWPTPWDPTGRHGNQHCSLCERLQPAHLRFQGGSTTAYKNYCQRRPKLQSHYTPPHECLLFEAGEKKGNCGMSLTLMLTGSWCGKRCSISWQRSHRLYHQTTSLRDRKDQIRGPAFANGGPAGDMQTANRHSS